MKIREVLDSYRLGKGRLQALARMLTGERVSKHSTKAGEGKGRQNKRYVRAGLRP